MAKSSKKNKKVVDSYKVLVVIFVLLVILLIGLSVRMYQLSSNNKDKLEADIVVPVLEENSSNSLNINLSQLEKDKEYEYVFKVTNFRDKKINSIKMNYNLNFSSSNDNVVLSLYKNDTDINLLKDNSLRLEDNSLKANDKETDLYRLTIKSLKSIDDVKITVTIQS